MTAVHSACNSPCTTLSFAGDTTLHRMAIQQLPPTPKSDKLFCWSKSPLNFCSMFNAAKFLPHVESPMNLANKITSSNSAVQLPVSTLTGLVLLMSNSISLSPLTMFFSVSDYFSQDSLHWLKSHNVNLHLNDLWSIHLTVTLTVLFNQPLSGTSPFYTYNVKTSWGK